jgi:hypothetical protein
MSIKDTLTNPIFIFISCFIIFMISVNQILDLAKPSKSIRSNYTENDQLYKSAYMIASTPGSNYQKVTDMMAEKFPGIQEASIKVGINPEIAKIPDKDQNNAIRLSVLDSRLNYLETKFETLTQAENENLLYKASFYFFGFLGWAASVVAGHMLTHITTRINRQSIDPWLDKKFPKAD